MKTSWILLAKRLIFESWHHFRKLLGLLVHYSVSKIRIVIPSSQREWWQTRRCAWIFVVFSRSVTSGSLRTRGLRHTRLLHHLPESVETHVHWVIDATQPSHPLSLPSPPAFSLSQNQGLFQRVGSSHQVAKVLELHFNIIPFYEYSGLISFRMDWFDLLAVQGTLKSLLQRHSSKASILQRSTFFMVHLSYPYMTTGRAIVLTRQTSAGKVMSLLLKVLSRFIVAFLPRILVGS